MFSLKFTYNSDWTFGIGVKEEFKEEQELENFLEIK